MPKSLKKIYNPRNEAEFRKRFRLESQCRKYFLRIRWPFGFRCPHCGFGRGYLSARGLYICRRCRKQTSATAGTLLEGTRKPMRQWFEVFWRVATSWQSVSAAEVQRALNLGSYRTAWKWLRKARAAAAMRDKLPLSSRVEIDEAWPPRGEAEPLRQGGKRALVLVMVQGADERIERIRLAPIPDSSRESLRSAIEAHVQPGAVICTDGWKGYSFLKGTRYRHEIVRKQARVGDGLLPLPRMIDARLRFWLQGTFQGAVRKQNLESYLAEFAFRYNQKKSETPELAFRWLLQAVAMSRRAQKPV